MTVLSEPIAFLNDDEVDNSEDKTNKKDAKRLKKSAAKEVTNAQPIPDQQCPIEQPTKSRPPMTNIN